MSYRHCGAPDSDCRAANRTSLNRRHDCGGSLIITTALLRAEDRTQKYCKTHRENLFDARLQMLCNRAFFPPGRESPKRRSLPCRALTSALLQASFRWVPVFPNAACLRAAACREVAVARRFAHAPRSAFFLAATVRCCDSAAVLHWPLDAVRAGLILVRAAGFPAQAPAFAGFVDVVVKILRGRRFLLRHGRWRGEPRAQRNDACCNAG